MHLLCKFYFRFCLCFKLNFNAAEKKTECCIVYAIWAKKKIHWKRKIYSIDSKIVIVNEHLSLMLLCCWLAAVLPCDMIWRTKFKMQK